MLDYAFLMLDAASRTQNPQTAEICLRKTISASYYAAFHAARAYRIRVLKSQGVTDHEDLYRVNHERLWEWAKEAGVRRNILIRCNTLRSKRSDADYQIQMDLTHDPNDCLQKAKLLVQEFEAMNP